MKPGGEVKVGVTMKAAEEVPKEGRQKFLVQAATTPLSKVEDIAVVLKGLQAKAVTWTLQAVFTTEEHKNVEFNSVPHPLDQKSPPA